MTARICRLPLASSSRNGSLRASALLFAALVVHLNVHADPGTVTFGNYGQGRVINSQTGNPATVAEGIRAALYWSPAGTNCFTQLGAFAEVGIPLPGIFSGGTRTTGPETQGGSSGRFMVRAWGGGHAKYEDAAAVPGELIGQSPIVEVVTGDPAGDPPLPPGSLMAAGLEGFSIAPNAGDFPLPLIDCPDSLIVECGDAWSFGSPTAFGGCGTNLSISLLDTFTNGTCPQVIVRTWLVADECGNCSICSQVVTIQDTTPPALTCAGNKTVECGSAWDFDPPEATDICSGTNVTVSILTTATNGSCPATVTRTWLATDACGNTNTCSQTVTVVDTTPPSLYCATEKTVSCGAPWDFDTPSATDICGEAGLVLSVIGTVTNGSCPMQVTRTWLAADACGNTNTCSQTVTIEGAGLMRLICADDKTVACDTNWVFDPPAVSGACDTNYTVEILNTITNGLCPEVVSRTWVVTNPCTGESSQCSQNVTVLCSHCALSITRECPPHPVPPGGVLAYTGTVTNNSSLTLTNVLVYIDQPEPNTLVFGPATFLPGEGVEFSGSYSVGVAGFYEDTLTVFAGTESGLIASNSLTTVCPAATTVVSGDRDGDGIVDQSELDLVLSNYWANSEWVQMTNAAVSHGDGLFEFALTNASAWNFSVLVSTNMIDWTPLPGHAYPLYQFHDPEATNEPVRYYRLTWP